MVSHIKSIKIHGFRGFEKPEILNFGTPTGDLGSGLTIIVGPNNSGKSSIIEAITAVTQSDRNPPTFSQGKRNVNGGDKVKITLTDSADNERTVSTVPSGGSETVFSGESTDPSADAIFVLPSRRTFAPFFGKGESNRSNYVTNSQKLQNTREGQSSLSGRIFHINNNPVQRASFNSELGKVLDPVPNWTIEQSEQGSYYLKYTRDRQSHSSDGLGEGILSTFFIVDALYDSVPGSVIVIDEPELSLHPQLQAKIRELILEYSKDRQIIISTHSPKFIDWSAIVNGAAIARVTFSEGHSKINSLGEESTRKISGYLKDMNNPHVLGTDANEIFFLSDRVVLVEGQEDVMFFPTVLSDINKSINGVFYGWGAGGADKFETIATILKELGFKKVVGIYDNDKKDAIKSLSPKFTEYLFVAQPADDIRYKMQQPDKISLLNDDGKSVRQEFFVPISTMVDDINTYFAS